MRRLLLAPLLASPLSAQGRLFEEDARLPPSLGVSVQAGLPEGAAATDLNEHVGWGLALSYPWHLGGRHLLRPNLEYNRYRVDAGDPPPFAAGTSQSPAFETWKVGVDYVIYQEPWVMHGPYVFAGVGLQHGSVDYLVQSGPTLVSHTSSRNSLWLGAGFGYQLSPDVALELRYSAADYAGEEGQPLAGYTATTPVKRDGRYLHFVLAVRAPF